MRAAERALGGLFCRVYDLLGVRVLSEHELNLSCRCVLVVGSVENVHFPGSVEILSS